MRFKHILQLMVFVIFFRDVPSIRENEERFTANLNIVSSPDPGTDGARNKQISRHFYLQFLLYKMCAVNGNVSVSIGIYLRHYQSHFNTRLFTGVISDIVGPKHVSEK